MTLNDDLGILQDGVDYDLTLTDPPAPDVSETDTPPDAPPADEPTPEAPPAPDPWAAVNALAEQQRQVLDLQRQQLERQNQPTAPAAWVDPYDRPENVTRLDDLEERATYDPQARADLRTLRRQLDTEVRTHERQQIERDIRAEMQAAQQVETVTGTLRNEARAYGDLVTDDVLTEVQNEIFANQPAHVRANALNDPALRTLIVQAAAGRRVLSGQARPPTAPDRPTPPPTVRSDNRAPTPSRPAHEPWNDPAYMDQVTQDAWRNPDKYGAKD